MIVSGTVVLRVYMFVFFYCSRQRYTSSYISFAKASITAITEHYICELNSEFYLMESGDKGI